MKCPAELRLWTADEIAECIPGVGDDLYAKLWRIMSEAENPTPLYAKLWRILSEAENPTPLGGDGTDGTVESPDGRWDSDNDDKASHWWGRLTMEERQTIVAGAKRDGIIDSVE